MSKQPERSDNQIKIDDRYSSFTTGRFSLSHSVHYGGRYFKIETDVLRVVKVLRTTGARRDAGSRTQNVSISCSFKRVVVIKSRGDEFPCIDERSFRRSSPVTSRQTIQRHPADGRLGVGTVAPHIERCAND